MSLLFNINAKKKPTKENIFLYTGHFGYLFTQIHETLFCKDTVYIQDKDNKKYLTLLY